MQEEAENNYEEEEEEQDDLGLNESDIEFLEAEEVGDENYDNDDLPENDEVLSLTEYDGNLNTDVSNNYIAAEYVDIDIVNVDKKHAIVASNFVNKITKFIIGFNDVVLSKEHTSYLKDVANLQLSNLQDLLSLVTINRSMLDNIVRRINAVQAEDYAMIAAYNGLANQHLKLLKELQNTYKAIPSVLKKMRTEVMCDQELLPDPSKDEVITEDFGNTQFTNTKHLLKVLRETKNNQQVN